MESDIRWKQRLNSLQTAFLSLKEAVETQSPSKLEKAGIIQNFEFTFELCWRTLKDYLNFQKVEVTFPREVLKEAFASNLISDGDTWMEMLDNRNLMSHTYDEEKSNKAYDLIVSRYFRNINVLLEKLQKI